MRRTDLRTGRCRGTAGHSALDPRIEDPRFEHQQEPLPVANSEDIVVVAIVVPHFAIWRDLANGHPFKSLTYHILHWPGFWLSCAHQKRTGSGRESIAIPS